MLFKQFGGVDAVPICLDTQDVDEIVAIVTALAPVVRRDQPRGHRAPRAASRSSAGSTRRCRHPGLPRRPARHGDRRARRAAQRRPAARPQARRPARRGQRRRRGRGRGDPDAARRRGRRDVVVLRLARASSTPDGRTSTRTKAELAAITNAAASTGGIADALRGADVLIGVSGGTIAEDGAGRDGARRASIFALANPTPEVHPDGRRAGTRRWWPPGAATSPTRSTTCWRSPASSGARWTRGATRITEAMKIAAAEAIAGVVGRRPDRRTRSCPRRWTPGSPRAVAAAVAAAARRRRRGPQRSGRASLVRYGRARALR